MAVKSDKWIRKMSDRHSLIEPFEGGSLRFAQNNTPILNYGTSSCGYDVRCDTKFKVFTNTFPSIIDPKDFDVKNFVDVEGDVCILPAHGMVLAQSVEKFRIPSDIFGMVTGKNTYARCGVVVVPTTIDPGWHGRLTFTIHNTNPLPVKVYANEGIAHVLFMDVDERCDGDYDQRRGKYQGQRGISLPKV